MQNDKLYLGVDVGTSSVKLILVDEECKILGQESERYVLNSPETGWLEIDPEIWVKSFLTAAKRLLRSAEQGAVRRIGITGQMHTLVLMGEDGKAVLPAVMWNDLRTETMIPQIREDIRRFPDGEYLARIISTGSPLANLIWVKQNRPEEFKRICSFQIGWDYLVYRLTGRHCTDYCNASTSGLFSLRGAQWSEEIREYIGLNAAVYPECLGSLDIAGTLTEEFQAELGLPSTVEILVGTGDNPATVLSTGGLWSDIPVFSMGTSGVFTRIYNGKNGASRGKKILFGFHKDSYMMLEQGAVQSCGNTYDWWNRQSGCADIYEADAVLDIRQEVCNKVLFYPQLAGEKTLYADPGLRGMFVGLDLNVDRNTLRYAVLEGMAFAIRELIEGMAPNIGPALKVVGGASNNSKLMQILANVTNRKIEKLNGMSGAVYGIAYMTAKADQPEQIRTVTSRNFGVKAIYEPFVDIQEQINKKYDCYCRMRRAIHYIYGEQDL